jgi:hypothetical protein
VRGNFYLTLVIPQSVIATRIRTQWNIWLLADVSSLFRVSHHQVSTRRLTSISFIITNRPSWEPTAEGTGKNGAEMIISGRLTIDCVRKTFMFLVVIR